MSYRAPESGVYPTDLTSSDYNALIHIYGPVDTTNVDYSIVHRLLNVDTGQHLFTANSVEIDILTGQPQPPFIDEGIAYQVSSGANQDLYRFYNPLNGLHFYTASTYEKDFLISSDSTSLLFEGSAYKVFSNNVIRTDLTPVYRFYDSTNNTHLYTANSLERSGRAIHMIGLMKGLPGMQIHSPIRTAAPKPQISSLTSLRFFAALGIFFLHANNHSLFNTETISYIDLSKCVSFFFALSGFVLFYSYSDKNMPIVKFYLLRFMRVWPITLISILAILLDAASTYLFA